MVREGSMTQLHVYVRVRNQTELGHHTLRNISQKFGRYWKSMPMLVNGISYDIDTVHCLQSKFPEC